jgi:hypothetical protein
LQKGKAILVSISDVVFVSKDFEDFDLYVRTFTDDNLTIANSAIDDLTKVITLNPTAVLINTEESALTVLVIKIKQLVTLLRLLDLHRIMYQYIIIALLPIAVRGTTSKL